MRSDGKHAGTAVVSITLAAILLYLALRGVDWRRVWGVISAARFQYLALACGIAALSYFLRGLRWRVLLNAEGRLRVGEVFWANMAGYLGNNLMPARAGELVRTLLVSARSGLSKTYVLTTAFTERLIDAVVLAGVGAAMIAAQPQAPAWFANSARGAVALATAAMAALMLLPKAGDMIVRRLGPRTGTKARMADAIEQAARGVKALYHGPRLGEFALLTGSIWLLDATSTILGGRALGLHFSYPVALLLLAGLGLGSGLPSAPGYVGIYQFVAVTVLTPFGFSRSEALAYILVAQFLNYVMVGALGAAGAVRVRQLLRARERTGEAVRQ